MGEEDEEDEEETLSPAERAKLNEQFSPWSLLLEGCDPRRTCRNVSRKIDEARKKANAGPPIHMVFSVDSGKRYEWLALAFQFWWKRSQKWKTKGSRFTRLLSSAGAKPDHLMDKIPTFVAPLPEEFKTDHYLPYNKIVSVKNWIEAEHKNLPPDQIIAIMDVDIVLLEDLSYLAVDVKKGKVNAKKTMIYLGVVV